MKRLILIDDSEDTFVLVRAAVGSQYHVTWAPTAANAIDVLRSQTFDLILLDIQLPDEDGFSLCTKFQNDEDTRDTPIIFVTAKTGTSDLVTGLSLGADDYVEKPFKGLELLARVNAKVKKNESKRELNSHFRVGDLYINTDNQKVTIKRADKTEAINLTPIEYKILNFFTRHQDKTFSRDQIISAVWGETVSITDRTVDKHISVLRNKLEHCSSYIETVSGFGYKFSFPNTLGQNQKKVA